MEVPKNQFRLDQQTETGEYRVQWQTQGNAEELHVLVNGEELENGTLSNPGESVSVSVGDGDTISVSGSSGDTSGVISSTTSASGGTVSDPTVTSNPNTTLSNSTSSDTVTQGNSISVDYTVTNDGDEDRDMTISLEVSDSVGEVDSTTETGVSSGESRSGTLSWSVPSGQEPGEYTLTVSGGGETSTTTITIEERVMSEPNSSAPSDYTTLLNNMEGDGSESNPYVITNDHELQAISGDSTAYFVLGNDIDASETGSWNGGSGFNPVTLGDTDSTLPGGHEGYLDGQGHAVYGLTVDRPNSKEVGLIGKAIDSEVRNIGVVNADISTNEPHSGVLIGWTGGMEGGSLVENSYVVDSSVYGDYYVGSIVGYNSGGSTIQNSYAKGVTVTNNTDEIGGAVGLNYGGTIETTYATGTVNPTGGYAGGLNGRDYSGGSTVDSYYDMSPNNGVGTQLSTNEMQGSSAETNMTGFNFDSVWKTVDGDYPQLQDNPE